MKYIDENKKAKVAYYSGCDATKHIKQIKNYLITDKYDVVVVTTKVLNVELINLMLTYKNKTYLHFICNGMGKTMMEPNIPNIKDSFNSLAKLVKSGFPTKQVLVIIKPIIQNTNGLKSVKLMMQLFSQFPQLRLRFARFELLKYTKAKNFMTKAQKMSKNVPDIYVVASKKINTNLNQNINGKLIRQFLTHDKLFYREYKKLIHEYKTIITVDDETEPILGNRELLPFGFKNIIINKLNLPERVINYKNNKPLVDNILSNSNKCQNKCVLCTN